MNLDAYDRSRSIGHQPFRSACYAPFVALSFDVHGTVSVCAFTRSTPLGQIGDRPLREMWRSHQADALRSAVREGDLTRWCNRCAEEISGGNLHGVLASGFDQFVADPAAEWPTRMEFALTNVCNLQCIMCSGEYSSAIRSRREGMPALPDRYGESFLEELLPFLPHLTQARFLGGEPFLAEINFRIWEAMIDLGLEVDCNVTTNGTQWNARVERVLEALPFSIGVSVDGYSAETVEHIRAGASHRVIRENLDHFLDYGERRGTSVSLTFCLMVENWREFGAFLQFAEARGCQVYVNTVRQPPRHSLYRLPVDQLRDVVAELEREGETVAGSLDLNLNAWLEQIDRLRNHLTVAEDDAGAGRTHLGDGPLPDWDQLVRDLAARSTESEIVAALEAVALAGVVSIARSDPDETLMTAEPYLGVDVSKLVGRPSIGVHTRVVERFGHQIEVLAEEVTKGLIARVTRMSNHDGEARVVASVIRRGPDPYGTTRLSALLSKIGPTEVPVPPIRSAGDR